MAAVAADATAFYNTDNTGSDDMYEHTTDLFRNENLPPRVRTSQYVMRSYKIAKKRIC